VINITKLYVNNVSIEDYIGYGDFVVNSIEGRGPVQRTSSTVGVPSMDGAYFRRVQTDVRVLKVKFTIKAATLPELRYRMDVLNGLVNYDDPRPIRFSDEPTKTYFGVAVGDAEYDEVRSIGKGTLIFECYDPYKYGEEEHKAFYNGETTIVNEGNVDTKPRFETTVSQDLTHLDFIRKETGEYMRLGTPVSADAPTYVSEELLFTDDCTSTTGWSTAANVDNGYVAGSIVADGEGFYPELFGGAIQPYAWQGPAIKRGLGESLTDFKVSVKLENLNSQGTTGMIEVYMLDIDNRVVAKIGIEDIWRGAQKIQGKFQLGEADVDRYAHYREADQPGAWNDFDGVIELTRDSRSGSNIFKPYFGLIDKKTGKHVWVSSALTFTDYEGIYQREVTQVQIAMRKWPITDETSMKVKEVSVWRLNPAPSESSVPYLARAGDRLTIDHATEDILVNGKSIKHRKEFGANYFSIPPGVSEIVQSPSDAGITNVYWRSKFR
jgi:predicted phage tail component-like protein